MKRVEFTFIVIAEVPEDANTDDLRLRAAKGEELRVMSHKGALPVRYAKIHDYFTLKVNEV